MVEWKTTKKGKKTFSTVVNGHKLSAYDINGKFSIRIDDEHVIYVSFEEADIKLKEYCEKLHYVNVRKFIEFENTNATKSRQYFRINSKDNQIFMSIHADNDEYLPMVKATDRKTKEKAQRQVAPKVYDYNEAVSIIQEKMNEYDTFGYFTRHGMRIRTGTEFVEEKLKEELDSDLGEQYSIDDISSKEEYEFLLKQQAIFKGLIGDDL